MSDFQSGDADSNSVGSTNNIYMKKFLLVALCLLVYVFSFAGVRRYNVFTTAGDKYWAGINFMTNFGLNPGDTVVIPSGIAFGHVELMDVNDIVFINEGPIQATIKSFNIYRSTARPGVPATVAQHAQVLGSGNPALQYGLKISGTNFAINWEAVGNLVFRRVEIGPGNAMGIKISTVPGLSYPLNYQNLIIEDCYIHDVGQEAMYIGRDELGGPYIFPTIKRNKIRRSGRDGIQVRNAKNIVIEANDVDTVGTAGHVDHDHGILIGGNSYGGSVIFNKVDHVPGYAMFFNGYGTYEIACNDFKSNGPTMFGKNYPTFEDHLDSNSQKYIIHDNILAGNALALQAYDNNNEVTLTIQYFNNKTSGGTDVQAGIIFTQSNNNNSVVPACDETTVPTNRSRKRVRIKHRT